MFMQLISVTIDAQQSELWKKWLMRIKGLQWASFVHHRERFPWVKNFPKGYLWMPSLIKENVEKDGSHNERQLDV